MRTMSKDLIKIKRRLITKIFTRGIGVINNRINLKEFKDEYFPDEDRTASINIDGMEDLPTGFVIEKNNLRAIDKLKDEPTVIFRMDEDTFIEIALQEKTFLQAFFYGNLDVEGENYMRDLRIFEEMFKAYGHVLGEIAPKGGG
jgi:hypothetical protein